MSLAFVLLPVSHYDDVTMSGMASQITSFTIVYSAVFSGRRSKKSSKPRVTGLCVGNSPGTGEFPAQMASNAETVFIWWRHHGLCKKQDIGPQDMPLRDVTLATWRHWYGSTLALLMADCFEAPAFNWTNVDLYHSWDPLAFTWAQFYSEHTL